MGPSRPAKQTIGVESTTSKKWWNLMPVMIVVIVIGEIVFLGRLDMSKNAGLLNSWADSLLYGPSSDGVEFVGHGGLGSGSGSGSSSGMEGEEKEDDDDGCVKWLENEDGVVYERDFDKDPVLVAGGQQEWNTCAVGCKFGHDPNRKADAAFGWPQGQGAAAVLRSMESAQYYAENNIANARQRGYNVIMTTSLSSDVPVGYFSWAEYDIMAPVQPKTENSMAAAFISNCGARNFRLQALEALEKTGISLDSYGACHHNRDEKEGKVDTLKHYKFSLAFENSNEEDYVTEKFFQSLVAGTIPVVVGPPNIQDFAPGPGSLLHIKELADVDSVAKSMKYLAANPVAYNDSLRWKYDGPSDSFKALVDMAAVHSSCRLCIHLATKIREDEEQNPIFKKRPCKCSRGPQTVYHVYVRERGRFAMESIFLRSSNLTMEALESAVHKKFSHLKHVPIWKTERPESIRGGDELKIYKIYPLGLTQRQALYTFKFEGENDFKNHIERNPCAKFEVIFV